MKSRANLRHHYPRLATFFCSQLGIDSAPDSILLEDIIELTSTAPIISAGDHKDLSCILQDIGRIIDQSVKEHKPNPTWISKLTSHPLFPIRVASTKELELRALEEEFYIRDENGFFFDIFRDEVDILELHSSVSSKQVQVFLRSIRELGTRYLDAAVTCSFSAAGERVEDSHVQENYLIRAPLIGRYANSTNPMPFDV